MNRLVVAAALAASAALIALVTSGSSQPLSDLGSEKPPPPLRFDPICHVAGVEPATAEYDECLRLQHRQRTAPDVWTVVDADEKLQAFRARIANRARRAPIIECMTVEGLTRCY